MHQKQENQFMPAPNATIAYGSPNANMASKSRARDKNRMGNIVMTTDPYGKRQPEFYVGIFNVNTRPLTVQRQWGVGQQMGDGGQASIGGLVTVNGRAVDDLYGKPVILRDIEHMQKLQPGSDEILLVPVGGEFLAQDLCNCNDLGGSWKTAKSLSTEQQMAAGAVGNNYYERGIFWCRLATPDAEPDMEAVDAAITNLERYYQKLLEEANRLYQSGPKGQQEICDPHHEAAEYFIQAGNPLDLPWHATLRGGLHGMLKKKSAADKAAGAEKQPAK
jgi:hypothetical protein